MDVELPHPPWCVPAHCNIDCPPIHGVQVGMHRSAVVALDALVLRLVQPVGAQVPRLEFRFGDDRLAVPLVLAEQVPRGIAELFAATGPRP